MVEHPLIGRVERKVCIMKVALALVLATGVTSAAWSQSVSVVRGVGTQTCKALAASDKVDEKFALQSAQWILGYVTAYFRQASDNPSSSRSIGDAILLQTVLDVCKNNPDKTIDEAVTLTIQSMPVTEVPKKPVAEVPQDEK
jgi:predicted ribosomally synthesized peptide with SipW-like signal peptide